LQALLRRRRTALLLISATTVAPIGAAVGSQNQDQRSLLLDGEATCLVSGPGSLVAAGDMLLLTTAGVFWLDGPEEARVRIPAPSNRDHGIAWLTEGIF
jgi:hypothetical protein